MLHLSDTARSFNLAERCYDGIEETSDESLVRHAIEELCHIYWQRNVKIVDPPIGTTAILATNKKYMELLHFFFQKGSGAIHSDDGPVVLHKIPNISCVEPKDNVMKSYCFIRFDDSKIAIVPSCFENVIGQRRKKKLCGNKQRKNDGGFFVRSDEQHLRQV